VEQTASGYEVAWKVTGADQYATARPIRAQARAGPLLSATARIKPSITSPRRPSMTCTPRVLLRTLPPPGDEGGPRRTELPDTSAEPATGTFQRSSVLGCMDRLGERSTVRGQACMDAAAHCEKRAASAVDPAAKSAFATAASCWHDLAQCWRELPRQCLDHPQGPPAGGPSTIRN
jgi:hypothetical protein